MHGGQSPKGPENGNWKHGLYSEYLSEEDEKVVDALEDEPNAEKLQKLIDHHMARYLRAADIAKEPEWRDKLNHEGVKVGEELDAGDGPLAQRANLISRLIERYQKVTEGEKKQVEHSGDAGIMIHTEAEDGGD